MLTERQGRFVDAYVANGGIGTAAAREAGYAGTPASMAVTAVRLRKHPLISRAFALMAAYNARTWVEIEPIMRSRAGVEDVVESLSGDSVAEAMEFAIGKNNVLASAAEDLSEEVREPHEGMRIGTAAGAMLASSITRADNEPTAARNGNRRAAKAAARAAARAAITGTNNESTAARNDAGARTARTASITEADDESTAARNDEAADDTQAEVVTGAGNGSSAICNGEGADVRVGGFHDATTRAGRLSILAEFAEDGYLPPIIRMRAIEMIGKMQGDYVQTPPPALPAASVRLYLPDNGRGADG